MSEQLRMLSGMVAQGVAGMSRPTGEAIRGLIASMRTMQGIFDAVTDQEAEMLAREVEELSGVSMGVGAVIDDGTFKPWLNDAKAGIEPFYWSRYDKLLRGEKAMSGDVVRSLDEVTDRILGRLGDPRNEAKWDRRGMVVGHVQSGKTANYTGLVCKAADAGYRLIVVIAGIHNNLRNQTQARIDEGFIGRDTGHLLSGKKKGGSGIIGVGRFAASRFPVSLTNTFKDFNKDTATTNTSQISSYAVPVVLVIKKNSSTLRNLVEWLREHSAGRGSEMVDQPMLLIDDEADNASINVAYKNRSKRGGDAKDEVSRINSQIRALLKLFRRSCYVGYTATPFANIFIDPDTDDQMLGDDLFPRNFIIGLDAPTNYFGARKVFIDGMPEEGTPTYLRYIDDNEDVLPVSHKIEQSVDALPPSLVRALRAFLVGRAIRNLRGQAGAHASMLVNASRFTGVQERLRNRLRECVERIQNEVRLYGSTGAGALRYPEISALHEVWQAEFRDAHDDWPAIQGELLAATAAAKVVQVNSRENGLDYSDAGERGLTVIAVGGFSLSRGLTLEGLTVSYFLRNSVMYDTLMQMGRWFGYRRNYEDLCRIWMPEEAAGWYAHIAAATEELQDELKRMEAAKATPEEFGLAVRGSPSGLLVTARNKMGSGEKMRLVGLSNAFVETAKLLADPASLETNRQAARRLLAGLDAGGWPQTETGQVNGGYLVRDVPADLIDAFLLEFRNADESVATQTSPVRRYIRDRADDELKHWDVFVPSVRDPERADDMLGWSISPLRRGIGDGAQTASGILAIGGSKMRVASRGIERVGLDEGTAEIAEARYLTDEKIVSGGIVNYPDRIYRRVRSKPLFILYLLQIKEPEKDPEKVHAAYRSEVVPKDPVVGWGISFPTSEHAQGKVEYIINTTKFRELFGDEDEDEDTVPDDD